MKLILRDPFRAFREGQMNMKDVFLGTMDFTP
jgi:hypothetical protein